MKNKKNIAILVIILVLAFSLACSMTGETQTDSINAATKVALTVAAIDQPAAQNPQQPAGENPAQPPAAPGQEPPAQQPPAAQAAPPDRPASLQNTIAALDSYKFILKYYQKGKTPKDTTILDVNMDSDKDNDAFHAVYTMQNVIKISDSDAQTEPETQEVWAKDTVSCTKNADGEYESSKRKDSETSNTKDLLDLLDIMPRIDNPEFIDVQTVNDIPCNHFKFNISNYMADSGWIVTRNEGEYWVAQDGQFLIKYKLFLDARSAPEGSANADFIEVSLEEEIQNINKPVSVEIPSACPPPTSE